MPRDLNRAQMSFASSYSAGDTVIFTRQYKTFGVEKGDKRTVARLEHNGHSGPTRQRDPVVSVHDRGCHGRHRGLSQRGNGASPGRPRALDAQRSDLRARQRRDRDGRFHRTGRRALPSRGRIGDWTHQGRSPAPAHRPRLRGHRACLPGPDGGPHRRRDAVGESKPDQPASLLCGYQPGARSRRAAHRRSHEAHRPARTGDRRADRGARRDHRDRAVLLEGADGAAVRWKPGEIAGRRGAARSTARKGSSCARATASTGPATTRALGWPTAGPPSASVETGRLAFRLGDGRRFDLRAGDPQPRHHDHAWANTMYAFQGCTVDNVIAAMEANHPHLTAHKTLYCFRPFTTRNMSVRFTASCARNTPIFAARNSLRRCSIRSGRLIFTSMSCSKRANGRRETNRLRRWSSIRVLLGATPTRQARHRSSGFIDG